MPEIAKSPQTGRKIRQDRVLYPFVCQSSLLVPHVPADERDIMAALLRRLRRLQARKPTGRLSRSASPDVRERVFAKNRKKRLLWVCQQITIPSGPKIEATTCGSILWVCGQDNYLDQEPRLGAGRPSRSTTSAIPAPGVCNVNSRRCARRRMLTLHAPVQSQIVVCAHHANNGDGERHVGRRRS